MGIKIEFNPDLALRNISEYKSGNRAKEECIPEDITEGEIYDFLKKDQRNYWLDGELPLLETKGDGDLSKPQASIIILEATHFKEGNDIFTKGRYRVVKIINNNETYFNGFGINI